MKPSVLVTRNLPGRGIGLLKERFEVEANEGEKALSKDEMISRLKGKDALVCLLTEKIDAEIMDASPDLKVISNYAVGFDNVDVKAATERGILVANTPGVLTDTTADLTFTLLMAIARRVAEADRFAREGRYKGWDPMLLLGQDVYDKTLGIVGMGRIGSAVAARAAKGFGMKILYNDKVRNEKLEKELGARRAGMETLLKGSDFVSLHVPLMTGTRHLIGEKELSMMKRTACLVNTSRGPVIDEQALIKSLKSNEIFGAALDVFEFEPSVPEELRRLDNVIIVPHIASASVETRSLMGEMAAKNVISALEGKAPPSLVNEDVLGKSRIKFKE